MASSNIRDRSGQLLAGHVAGGALAEPARRTGVDLERFGEPNCIYAGVPAQMIRKIEDDSRNLLEPI